MDAGLSFHILREGVSMVQEVVHTVSLLKNFIHDPLSSCDPLGRAGDGTDPHGGF